MHSLREGILDGSGDGPGKLVNGRALSMRSFLRGLRHLLWPKATSNLSDGSRQLRPTAYLDGLRGFAAFLVYIHHHELWAHGAYNLPEALLFENAFGYKGKYRFATFYGIRNFFTGGHISVAMFYVISGYVLSVKPLALMQSGEHLKLADNLASAFFRRWFRLYGPIIITTLVYITSWHVFGYWNFACEPKATFREELWEWYVQFKNFSFLFKGGDWIWMKSNTHTWSIPLEMRGSMIVYMACLALSRATTKARLLCEAALMIYFMYIVDGYYGSLFIGGMMQADLDLLARKEGGYFPGFLRRLEKRKTLVCYILFFIGLYLAGVPSSTANLEDVRANPGWYWLSYLKPQAVFDPKWFYLFWGGMMLVACIPRMPWLRRFFETRFCQFLGRVSYALYLVHGPILATIGDRLYHAIGWSRPVEDGKPDMLAAWRDIFPLPKTGPMGLELSFLLPHLFLLPLTLWMADVVTRAVDEPCVKFAAWLYKRVQGGGQPEPKPEENVAMLRLA
ncbi:acyltransferase 3 [Podospora australis]|uniref:Acyltransferase 3 n=1 Tax=Podospora australis TaxID=1536484 RepID=A0AAN6WZR8_9PEZI|nr:acyltransferase 3 [Podospora australis]